MLEPAWKNIDSNEFLKKVPTIKEHLCKYSLSALSMGRWGMKRVDEDGNILYEEQGNEEKSTVTDREIEVVAKDVEGYTLIGDKKITHTVVESDDGKNIIEFVYKSNEPEPEPEPENPENPENPEEGGEEGGSDLGIFG